MRTPTETREPVQRKTAPRRPSISVGIPRRGPPSEPDDRSLRNAKLRRLHGWLRLYLERYVGLYETGSVPAGDPWVEGRSDRDILIVVDGQITSEGVEAISGQLEVVGFTDTYLFNIARRHGFLRTHSDHDIAMKFRGATLFGEDLLAQKEAPSRVFAERWAEAGLRTMPGKLRIRVMNAPCWSAERLRDDIYFLLKQMFLFLAARSYANTGHYPRRRFDVADAYSSVELRELARDIVTIDRADKASLTESATSAIKALHALNR
jgi:hypothetical protein